MPRVLIHRFWLNLPALPSYHYTDKGKLEYFRLPWTKFSFNVCPVSEAALHFIRQGFQEIQVNAGIDFDRPWQIVESWKVNSVSEPKGVLLADTPEGNEYCKK